MHPPERGLGQKPRNQRPERERDGTRPLLQGHLKPSKRRGPAAPPAPPATKRSSKGEASEPPAAEPPASEPPASEA